ncbi:MAG: hypothetical protein KKD77_21565 [Gammaproteobacteria bacterium]|nr:hypothetical protein [Gammaproteobacteria bacterium]
MSDVYYLSRLIATVEGGGVVVERPEIATELAALGFGWVMHQEILTLDPLVYGERGVVVFTESDERGRPFPHVALRARYDILGDANQPPGLKRSCMKASERAAGWRPDEFMRRFRLDLAGRLPKVGG